jgi:multiple sugar transport system permease protein
MTPPTVTGSVASSEPARTRRPPLRRILPTQQPAPPRRIGRHLTGWAFAGPATLVVVGLSLFPALWAFLISRENWDGITPAAAAGWSNYTRLADDPDLRSAVAHTLFFTAVFVPASILLGMLIATGLNKPIRLVAFYRTAIFVPFVASAAATGILANFVFNPQFGLANNALRVAHLPQQQFLESGHQALLVICLIALWGEIGFTVVVYLAALQDMPREITEAAMIDGANALQVFRYVTLPQLAPVTVFVAVWQTITALQLFDLVFTTTRGGPLGATQTVVYYVYYQAFQLSHYGYGSAVAYILFAVTMLITAGMVVYARHSKLEAF